MDPWELQIQHYIMCTAYQQPRNSVASEAVSDKAEAFYYTAVYRLGTNLTTLSSPCTLDCLQVNTELNVFY